jgi:hypothetical protein
MLKNLLRYNYDGNFRLPINNDHFKDIVDMVIFTY